MKIIIPNQQRQLPYNISSAQHQDSVQHQVKGPIFEGKELIDNSVQLNYMAALIKQYSSYTLY